MFIVTKLSTETVDSAEDTGTQPVVSGVRAFCHYERAAAVAWDNFLDAIKIRGTAGSVKSRDQHKMEEADTLLDAFRQCAKAAPEQAGVTLRIDDRNSVCITYFQQID